MKMNFCPHSKNILDYILGTLERNTRHKFEAHLKKCKLCQKELQIESVIAAELAERLQPGEIEDRVLARVRLLKAAKTNSSWLYLFRMAIYTAAAIMLGSVFSPKFAEFFSKQNFGFSINFFQEFIQTLASFDPSLIFVIMFGIVLVVLSSVFSYVLLSSRE
jgi:hypothetical protein